MRDGFGESTNGIQNDRDKENEHDTVDVNVGDGISAEEITRKLSNNCIAVSNPDAERCTDDDMKDTDLMEVDTEDEGQKLWGYSKRAEEVVQMDDKVAQKDDKIFDNAIITCEHGKLNPLALGKAKRICVVSNQIIYSFLSLSSVFRDTLYIFIFYSSERAGFHLPENISQSFFLYLFIYFIIICLLVLYIVFG